MQSHQEKDEHECPECETCPVCGNSGHVFTDEPYCDLCGAPHVAYYETLKRLIGYKDKRKEV